MKVIKVQNLQRNFKDIRALDGIDFDVEPGEIFGVLGPNGAGKTTTIRILTCQLRPSGGSAKVAGYDVVDQRQQLKPCIGVVFEHQNLYERLSARDNLNLVASLYGVDHGCIDQALEFVGLQDRDREPLKKYSNGMKQRLMIARAILHRPRVIFMDEPTRGLDPHIARGVRRIIKEFSARGVTVLLTTHYMEEADQLCDRIAILDQGRMIALNTPEQLKSSLDQNNASLEDVFIHLTGRQLWE